MNKTLIITATVAVWGLTACSGSHDLNQPHGSTEYLNQHLNRTPIAIPAGLKAPQFNQDYFIPVLENPNPTAQLGKSVIILPPRQLLPVVEGSQVGQVSKGAMIWYRNAQQSLPELSSTLRGLLRKELPGALSSVSDDTQIWQTDWIGSGPQLPEVRVRYLISFKTDESLQRLGVWFKATAAEQRTDGKWHTIPTNNFAVLQQQNLLLNQLSLNYQSYLEQQITAASAGPITIMPGKDGSELDAWIADAPFEVVWERLQRLLPELGFTITQSQQALGEVSLEYNDETNSSDKGALESGKYRILLGDLGQQTSLTLYRKESTPIHKAQYRSLTPKVVRLFAKGQQSVAR